MEKQIKEKVSRIDDDSFIVEENVNLYSADNVSGMVPSEVEKNHVSVGGWVGSVPSAEKVPTPSLPVDSLNRLAFDNAGDIAYYNPHNARFYFNFDKSTLKFKKSFEVINGFELLKSSFQGCRIVIKKVKIEITNTKDSKRIFVIRGSADERKEQVANANAILELEAIEVLRAFMSFYGGQSDCKVTRAWIPDNKVLHEHIVNKIPVQMTFRNDVVKKVYNEHPINIEFSDPAYTSNYFRNAGLYDYAPMIAKAWEGSNMVIDKLADNQLKTSEQIKDMSYNATSHIALVREAKDSINTLTGVVLQLKDVIIELQNKESWIKKLWRRIKNVF